MGGCYKGRTRGARTALRPIKEAAAPCMQLEPTRKVRCNEACAGLNFLLAASTWGPLPKYLKAK
eukprot:3378831-Pyramimonas_sp.AAC.1